MNKLLFALVMCSVTFAMPQRASAVLARKIAIWDNTSRTGEGAEHLYSVQHLVKVAGLPAISTTDFSVALQSNVVIASSYLSSGILTATERTALAMYLAAGGTIIVPQMRDSNLYSAFGVSAVSSGVTTHYKMNWTLPATPNYAWNDQPEERQISFARNDGSTASFTTRSFTLTTATALANYPEDGKIAGTKNVVGAGKAIALGFYWKDLVSKNQVNRDANANRTYSNGYEPTTDTVALFIRSVFSDATPFSPYLHTSPGNSTATLMVTHDIDSTSSMVMMRPFSDIETAHNIKATYNVTVHYLADKQMSAFYNATNRVELQYVLKAGHLLASHSVCHAPDFASSTAFPVGVPVTSATYAPYIGADLANTTGGTLMGEIGVSKSLLQADFPATADYPAVVVRSFRSGYLAFNNSQIDVEQTLGYQYDSSFSANDVLTNYPYRIALGRSSSGAPSSIYEIPMTISDVFSSDPISDLNYNAKQAIWSSVLAKNAQNNAPTVLLIHPNRTYKQTALSNLIAQIPAGIYGTTVDAFGDFWKARDSVSFSSAYNAATNALDITLAATVDPKISFVVPGGASLTSITVRDAAGTALTFARGTLRGTDALLSRFSPAVIQ